MADAGNWCLIESDPGVFSELIRDFGKIMTSWLLDVTLFKVHFLVFFVCIEVQGVQVEELWSLDPEQFDNLKYSFIQ